ncbi:MAG TPA: hypothetical protein DIT73_06655, partial [Gammaproteobacteria bacterium]|nr:hypothetical protein [Gammaproteobacteria bacterium]
MIRFRLRTVLVGLSLIVMILPLAGIQILRLYESALIRQTESELRAQGAFVIAVYRQTLRTLTKDQMEPKHQRPGVKESRLASSELDLATTQIHPPLRVVNTSESPDPIAQKIGLMLAPVIAEASTTTFAEIYVSDRHGLIVTADQNALGKSIAASDPVNTV